MNSYSYKPWNALIFLCSMSGTTATDAGFVAATSGAVEKQRKGKGQHDVAGRWLSACDDYTLYLSDSFGDGWNDIYLHLDGSSYTIDDDDGSSATYTVCLAPGNRYYPYTCDGEWGSEASWYIADPDGVTVAEGSGIDCDGAVCSTECSASSFFVAGDPTPNIPSEDPTGGSTGDVTTGDVSAYGDDDDDDVTNVFGFIFGALGIIGLGFLYKNLCGGGGKSNGGGGSGGRANANASSRNVELVTRNAIHDPSENMAYPSGMAKN